MNENMTCILHSGEDRTQLQYGFYLQYSQCRLDIGGFPLNTLHNNHESCG